MPVRVLNATVDWMLQWENVPEATIFVDDLPKMEDFRFQRKDVKNHALFWAEVDGFVRFYAHSTDLSQNDGGFGGAVIPIIMEDGTEVSLKGPWSSRASVMNAHFPHCDDAILRLPNDGPGIAGLSLRIHMLDDAFAKYCPGVRMFRYHLYGYTNADTDREFCYQPHYEDFSRCQKRNCDVCKKGHFYKDGVPTYFKGKNYRPTY